MLSGSISANGTNGNNNQVLGIVNGKPEWMNISVQISEDNLSVNSLAANNLAANNLSVNTGNIENISTNNLNVANAVINSFNANTSTIENLNANNLSVNTGNIENISTNNLNVVDLMLSGSISANGTNGNNNQVLGIVNGKPEWMNIPDQINEDNFVVNNISISNHAIFNGFNIIAMTVMSEDDYNNVRVKNNSLLYFTTPNGNLYLNQYGYSPNILPPPLYSVFVNAKQYKEVRPYEIYSLSLSEPSVTNNLICAGIYGVKENDKWNNSHSIGLDTAGAVWKTNADYLYIYDASNMYSNSSNLIDTFIINYSLISGGNNYDPMQYCVNMCKTFANCYNFNQPVTIPNNVTDVSNMFRECHNFNQPVTISNNVTKVSDMFYNCYRFNQPVTIPNNLTNVTAMFSGCHSFNQPVTIPNNVTDVSWMFSHCYNFTQPVTIPNNVTNVSAMFRDCRNFNQPVTIPDNVIDTMWMFHGCHIFNQPVTIPNNVISVPSMFWDCYNFNQPVTIPNNVTSAASMFRECHNFNQPVTIPNNVTTMSWMFYNCYNFNQPVTIPNNVTKVSDMFYGCNELNNSSVPIHISHSIILGDTSNYIYNALVNGNTGINFAPSRILNDA